MSFIHFNVPPYIGTEFKYMKKAVENHKICGDGVFTKKCDIWMERRFNAEKVLLTTCVCVCVCVYSIKALKRWF